MMTTEQRLDAIEKALTNAFQPSQLEVIDEGYKHVGHAGAKTGRGHFKIVIESPQFEGLSRLAVHRQIYGALGALMDDEIHALSITIL